MPFQNAIPTVKSSSTDSLEKGIAEIDKQIAVLQKQRADLVAQLDQAAEVTQRDTAHAEALRARDKARDEAIARQNEIAKAAKNEPRT